MRAFFVFIYLLFSILVKSQTENRFLQFGVKDGLSQNSVHCIYRDKEGLVWIGTQDGLNSFDGQKFVTYKPIENDSTSISDQFILAIQEDSGGYLWVGTRHGLNKLDKRTGKFKRIFISPKEKLLFQVIYASFFCLKNGNVLICQNSNVYNYNNKTQEITVIKNIPLGDLLINHNEKAIVYNKNNGLYISKEKDTHNFEKIAEPITENGLTNYASNNKFFIASTNKSPAKVYIFNIEKKQWLNPFEINGFVNKILLFNDSLVHFATNMGIISLSNFEQKNYLLSAAKFAPGAVLTLYKDVDKNLWAGTANNGFALNSAKFNNFETIQTPIKNDVVNVSVETAEYVWIGCNSGLYKQTIATKTIETIAALKNKKITALTANNKNNIWVGVDGEGLWLLNKNGIILKKYQTHNSIFKTNQILHLSADKKDNIFVSTELKFYTYAILKNKWEEFESPNQKGNYILHSFKDSKNNIWLSTNYGVVMYDSVMKLKLILESTTDTSSLKRTLITCITEDVNGVIWIATISNSIYTFENNKLTHFSANNGLASNVVYNLLVDNKNRIWATTSNGLFVFDQQQKLFTKLSTFDGIQQVSFTIGSMTKGISGLFYIGTNEGLLVCNPNNVLYNNKSLVAKIIDVKLNGQSIENLNNELKFKPDNKTLSFEFGTSEAFQQGNIIYQYKLLGVDNDWITLPAGSNKLTYTSFQYKKMEMQIKAAFSMNGLNNAPITSFKLNAIPPLYKTIWFVSLLGLLLIGLIAFFVQQYNNRKLQKQKLLLDTQLTLQKERERIGRDLHDNIGAYTSALIARLNQLSSKNEEQKANINELKDYAGSIMGYLRETIWVLNNETLNITAFADRFKNYAFKINKSYPEVELKISENISLNKKIQPQVMLNLFRILQEALQNAYKHANANKIEILFTCIDNIKFEIIDEGIGLSAIATTENYGLSNMKQRAKDIDYSFQVKPNMPSGTKVIIEENTANAVFKV